MIEEKEKKNRNPGYTLWRKEAKKVKFEERVEREEKNKVTASKPASELPLVIYFSKFSGPKA